MLRAIQLGILAAMLFACAATISIAAGSIRPRSHHRHHHAHHKRAKHRRKHAHHKATKHGRKHAHHKGTKHGHRHAHHKRSRGKRHVVAQPHISVKSTRSQYHHHVVLVVHSIVVSNIKHVHLTVRCGCERFKGKVHRTHKSGVTRYTKVNWIIVGHHQIELFAIHGKEIGRYILLGAGAHDKLVYKATGCLRPGRTRDHIKCPSHTKHKSVGTVVAVGTPPAAPPAPGAAQPAGSGEVKVSLAGSGKGSVSGSGISCPSTCSHSFPAGTKVTLKAAPESKSSFSGWSGACKGTGECTLHVESDESVTASFAAYQTLTVAVTGSGAGTVTAPEISCPSTCAASYPQGTEVTLTAAPGAGTTFAGWSGACKGTGACTVSMQEAQSVTAAFTLNNETLIVNRSGPSQGSVSGGGISCGGACSVTVPYGTSITISAHWPWDVRFDAWQNGGCAGTGSCTIKMTSNVTVGAPFSGYFETAGSSGATTFSNPYNESGLGPRVGAYQTIQVSCRVNNGLPVSDGNPYYYRIASGPWNSSYYASADPFYNDGATSGGLEKTPFVDAAVPGC